MSGDRKEEGPAGAGPKVELGSTGDKPADHTAEYAALRARFDALLEAEHALSDSYVRIREIVGAMDPPIEAAPALYAYVEGIVRKLAAPAADRAVSELVQRLNDEADQCRNDGADDIAGLLDEAARALAPPADRAELAAKAKTQAQHMRRLIRERVYTMRDMGAASIALDAAIDALARSTDAPSEPKRTYGSQYTTEQRAWCEKYERETTFEPLMCDFEAGNESFLQAAKNSRAWFESWSNDAYLRGCDDIPGEMEALHEEITGEKL